MRYVIVEIIYDVFEDDFVKGLIFEICEIEIYGMVWNKDGLWEVFWCLSVIDVKIVL